MTTQTIGIKEFRQNMTKLYRRGQKHKICYIVMNHQVPVMRIEPIDEDRLILEKYRSEIEEALEQVKRGETYTAEEVRAMLSLRKK